MRNDELRKNLCDSGFSSTILCTNPSYDKSIVGITDNGRIIYSYERMVKEFAEDNECTETEAMEFIDYNTVRALPYAGENAPIIMYNVEGVSL
jgi:hypothetical protein